MFHVSLSCMVSSVIHKSFHSALTELSLVFVVILVFSSLPYQIHWVQQTCSLVNLIPRCVPVKSRGALLSAFARDGLLLAVAVNQNDPKV